MCVRAHSVAVVSDVGAATMYTQVMQGPLRSPRGQLALLPEGLAGPGTRKCQLYCG